MIHSMNVNCPHCGNPKHAAVCPLVKAIEYFPDGTLKRVEYRCVSDYRAPLGGASMPGPVAYSVADLQALWLR